MALPISARLRVYFFLFDFSTAVGGRHARKRAEI